MTDIVVTYLNERDEKWQQDFNYWKSREIKEKKNKLSNRQAFGIERTREWDFLHYWFRGIEANCKWVNKVFLVVQNERHVPKWLDRNNPKLRIVYHEEFIPKELLPTFNPMTICMYISNIKDLSENYIMSDDDYFFLNPIKENQFFKEGNPVHPENKIRYGLCKPSGTDKVFYEILNTTFLFETQFMKKKVKYGFYHLPEARLKSFEQDILKRYDKEIKYHNSFSKFRHKMNLCPYMYSDLLKICKKSIEGNPYKNSAYCDLRSNIDFSKYKDKDIVCFNDTERLDDYDKTKENLIKFLDDKFPRRSEFEL